MSTGVKNTSLASLANKALRSITDEDLCSMFGKGGTVSVEAANEAKTELFKRWIGRIHNYLLRDFSYLANYAEDIAKKVVTNSIDSISRNGLGVSFGTYVYQAARNEAFQHKKMRMRRRAMEEPYCDVSMERHSSNMHANNMRQQVVYESQMEAIKAAVTDLRPEERGILVLEIYEGRSLADIAYMYGVATATVRQRKSRTLEKIRNHPAVKQLLAEL